MYDFPRYPHCKIQPFSDYMNVVMPVHSMTSKTADSSSTSQVLPQGDNAVVVPEAGTPEHQSSRNRNQVFKSGHLFISSKGIGWTSWKKRWFILTRTSLVFFRSDPSAAPQKGGEVNLTLGGIDLNNSASVEVKVDKKLLTVLFPDGRDGRAFTLKAETLEDLNEWKTALENALQVAPIATNGAGQNGLLKNEQADAADGSADQQKDKPPIKSMVIGRPILLALEDIDGSPSFLEKALRFIEDHGVKVEGILRQAADVDHVHHRVREYEQGKTEFSPEEDAHVIADCIKYILRELPSSPVPASCCKALLEAFRTDRNNRRNAMRTAILETFPEPNRRLLQRILLMMQTVASNVTVNRMSTSAVAACMSPLLLRPLLAGDCELENTHMDVAGDGSFQLLQAAAAANHAQAIVITLLDEYNNIFGVGSMSAALFSNSDESGTGTEEASDDGTYDEDDDDYIDDDDEYGSDDHGEESWDHEDETDDDYEHSVTETCSESGDPAESDSYDEKTGRSSSFTETPKLANNHITKQRSPSSSPLSPARQNDNKQGVHDSWKRKKNRSLAEVDDTGKSRRHTNVESSSENESASSTPRLGSQMSSTKVLATSQIRRRTWGRTSARKNLSMESIDFSLEDEDDEIQRLKATKIDLQNKIAEEASGNAILQASLERRKKALHERRLALEKDVSRVQEQLQKEKDLRAALEAGPNISQVPSSRGMNEKIKIDLQEIALAEENFNNLKQRFDDLGAQLNHQHVHNAALLHDREIEMQGASSQQSKLMNGKDREMKGTPNHVETSSKDDGHRNYATMDGGSRDTEWNGESSFSIKNLNQPNDTSRGGLPKSEVSVTNPIPSPSRKSSSKGEESTTTSALSKLTNRLNFLKERRNQIASELQNINKSKGSSNQPALSPGKGKAPELPVIQSTDKNDSSGGNIRQNQDDRTHQSSQNSANWMSTEVEKKDDNSKSDNKRSSNSRPDAPSSYSSGSNTTPSCSTGRGMLNEVEKMRDNKDSNKKSDIKRSSDTTSEAPSSYSSEKGLSNEGEKTKGDYKDGNNKYEDRSSNSRDDATSSHCSGKGMLNEDKKIEGDYKDGNKKNDNRSSNSRDDATSSYISERGMLNEVEKRECDNRDSNKKKDDERGSNSRDDSKSSYSSGRGILNNGEKNEGDNKDGNKKKDDKKGSDSRSDDLSSYSSGKGMSNEGDNKDNKKTNNKDSRKTGSSSKSDTPLSHSSVKLTVEGDSNEYNKKTEKKSGKKKGFFSSKNSDNQSNQNLDRLKSEGQASRNSDKVLQQDAQQSGTSRTLSR